MRQSYCHRPGPEDGGDKTTFGRFLRRLGLERALSDRRGGVMLTFAIVFPVLLLILGSTIDYGYMLSRRTSLQASADAAALAGANELLLANADQKVIESLTQSTVIANLGKNSAGVKVATEVSFDARAVTVHVKQTPGFYIMDGLGGVKDSSISAQATAGVAGNMPICMLILDDNMRGAIDVNSSARITGNQCAVYSNSVSSSGINTKNGALLQAALTCSAGGFSGAPDTYNPVPLTDCPLIDDPLASRPPPPVGPCLETDLVILSGTHTLDPGTYCGGLTIKETAEVTLNPGNYVIKDGQMHIGGSARLSGEYVGFYLTGKTSTFNFFPSTSVELSAPKNGPMAGILFFEDRNRSTTGKHVMRSNNARSFIGTIYLPRGEMVVDATQPLFQDSAYTVIIARTLNMFSGPNLVLNSNYGDSDVPPPSELGTASSPGEDIALIH